MEKEIMKSITQFIAVIVLSFLLLFASEPAMAKSPKHKRSVSSHTHGSSSKKSKKSKTHGKVSKKRSSGYAKASGYMSKRTPASKKGKKKHSSKKSKAKKKKKHRGY
jgi:hypothetical protein